MEVIPLGTGDFIAIKRYPTALLLVADGRSVLVDCPEPLFRMCAESSEMSGRKIDLRLIDDIVLTHLHGDHCNGLEAFAFWRRFVAERQARPHIYTSRAAADSLWARLAPAMAESTMPDSRTLRRYELSDYYEVTSFDFGSTFHVAGIEFETRRTLHTIPCFGFRASFRGRTFGYSSDTAFDPDLIRFLEPCDLVFHETGSSIHTPLKDLEALPREMQEKMRLIHLPDEFPGSSRIESAEAGRIYPV